jgi:hypothetical protein
MFKLVNRLCAVAILVLFLGSFSGLSTAHSQTNHAPESLEAKHLGCHAPCWSLTLRRPRFGPERASGVTHHSANVRNKLPGG